MKLLLVTVSIIAVLTVDGRNSPDDYGALDSAPVDTEGYNSEVADPVATLPIQDPISEVGDMEMLLGRSRWCRSRDGQCRRPKFPCPCGYQESPMGRPYCTSKKRRCCYPEKETTKSTTPTTSAPTTTAGCPDGFFDTAGSSQCYKFYNDTVRSYSDGKEMCQGEGLVLAEPTNPITLRKYLVETYGDYSFVYLGARGNGSNFRWERSGRQISNTDALWWTEQPGSAVSTSYCLLLLTYQVNLDQLPNQPYWSYACSNRVYTLCEYV